MVTYDLESSIHRPRGLSWSAFRLMFVTWLAGPVESKTAAKLTGMSRAAVSNLTKTLVGGGLMERTPDERDGRSVQLSLTEKGRSEIGEIYRRAERAGTRLGECAHRDRSSSILVMLLDKLITNRSQFDVRGRN